MSIGSQGRGDAHIAQNKSSLRFSHATGDIPLLILDLQGFETLTTQTSEYSTVGNQGCLSDFDRQDERQAALRAIFSDELSLFISTELLKEGVKQEPD